MRDREKSDSWNRWHMAILVYVGFIYLNSLTPSAVSSRESGFLLARLKSIMEALGRDHMWLTEHMVRKTAHFIEYAGLGFMIAQAYRIWDPPVSWNLKRGGWLVFLVPFADETIQLFVQGRSGQISDVWLDMAGAACGMFFTACLGRWLWAPGKRGRGGKDGQRGQRCLGGKDGQNGRKGQGEIR